MANDLIVRAGDRLTAALWNTFWRERRGTRLRPGPGVLLHETGDGTLISFKAAAATFTPAFKVTLTGSAVTVGRGLVNGWEPVMEDNRPISGILRDGTKDPKGQPRLQLRDDETMFDATGRSWILIQIEVLPDTGELLQPAENGEGDLGLTIYQGRIAPSTYPADDTLGTKPLAVLRRPQAATSGLGKLHQISMFDYVHRTAKQNGKWRHFIDPA